MEPTLKELATVPDGWTFRRYSYVHKCCDKRLMLLEKALMHPCGKHVRRIEKKHWCPCCENWITWGGY